jgi:signal transduction histidine kinase
MDRFDDLLDYLLAVLTSMGIFCGFATAYIALKVSRAALSPLRKTADVIAAIDEKNLSRRIDEEKLPTELVPMTKRLNEMLERLEVVFTQRKQFLADAAHELRTPIAAMMTTLEVALRRQRDPTALVEALRTALNDARVLRKLVERLMEHVRSDRAMNSSTAEEFDIAEMLREAANSVNTVAQERDVAIVVDVPAELKIVSHRERLRSVALNLISNAIEYNRPGGKIEIRCAADNDGLRLVVQDTGQGIEREHLPHVFEPFYRANRGKEADNEHLGLGLFLVQSHVQAMGGTCHIESEKGIGTTMTIVLPINPSPKAASIEPHAAIA